MIENIADRIFKNWKTTLVALSVFGLLTYMGIKQVLTWDVLSGYYAMAFTFLFVKDPGAEKRAAIRKAAQP